MTRHLRHCLALALAAASAAACVTARKGEPTSVPLPGAAERAGAPLPVPAPVAEPNGGRAPAFSPDGTQIAFLSSTLHTAPDLWVMNADGSGKRRLTARGASAFRWTPDGRTIQFVARRKGYEEVFSVALADGREERIPGLPPNAGVPLFSPDATLFAFTAPGEQGVRDLWVGTADRSRVEAVTEKINVRSFFWAPQGRKILYEPGKAYGLGLWEIDLSTMETRPLLSKYTGAPSFSAEAGRVAYPYPTDPGKFEVHAMKLDGTGVIARKAPRLGERWLAWAPDGTAVYYLGRDAAAPGPEEKRPEPTPSATNEAAKPVKQEDVKALEKKKAKKGAKPKRQGRSGRRVAQLDPRLAQGETAGSGPAASGPASPPMPRPAPVIAPHAVKRPGASPAGAASLWRLDLESGAERRASPEALHVLDFSLSPDGAIAAVTAVLPGSRAPEIFRLDLATGESTPLVASRPSAWMPIPSPDATRVAYLTNDGPLAELRVANVDGREVAGYPGFLLEGDAKFFWLPKLDGFLVFSGRGLHAFSEKGPVAFPSAKDHGQFLYADASIQEDRVALSTVPQYGETPGLYLLEAVGGAFVQRDLRFPPAPEKAADRYLQPRWSIDGRSIAFTDGIDVWATSADGAGRRRITAYAEANASGKETASIASFPVWSVRGSRLAYTLTTYAGRSVLRQLWVVEADGSSPRRVFSEEVDSQFQIFLPEYTSAPFFDPSDARLIATALHGGLPNVVSIDLASGKVTALTESGAVFPAMLPEEDAIVYTSLEGNDERIWIMSADGTAKRPFLDADRTQGGSGRAEVPPKR